MEAYFDDTIWKDKQCIKTAVALKFFNLWPKTFIKNSAKINFNGANKLL